MLLARLPFTGISIPVGVDMSTCAVIKEMARPFRTRSQGQTLNRKGEPDHEKEDANRHCAHFTKLLLSKMSAQRTGISAKADRTGSGKDGVHWGPNAFDARYEGLWLCKSRQLKR